jgi:release factor glutamine methyltransferase
MAEPRREARLLLAIALEAQPLHLISEPQRLVSLAEQARVDAVLARRLAGEPVSRIAGTRGFWTLDLAISPDVLDPRPETELLVELALAHVRQRRDAALRVLDLGTGSGCILLALLAELPNALGIGVDRSLAALAVARTNAVAVGSAERALWLAGDWAAPVRGQFDLVVSNPPYIPAGAVATLDRSVKAFDPTTALDGGPDGLAAYRMLVPAVADLLMPDGIACLEVGRGQAALVAALAAKADLNSGIHIDFAGIQRCVTIKR